MKLNLGFKRSRDALRYSEYPRSYLFKRAGQTRYNVKAKYRKYGRTP